MDAQSLDNHKKVLGIIYIVTATLTIVVALFLRAIMGIVFEFAMQEVHGEERRFAEFFLSLGSFLPAVIIIFSGIPTMIAGIGLLTRQGWAVIISLIVGCLKLFSVPIGTAIGIYAIWIYAEDQKLKRAATA
ncbi:MAG TPA: hypothetical protein VFE50_19755 [Cyclobacteriaceae bacterium]|nr:hypothetical protein [Cyclobacteriaceae bacterium]